MALPSAIQNLLTMSDPRFGGRGTTPATFAAATAGAGAQIGQNEASRRRDETVKGQLALAEQRQLDLMTRWESDREERKKLAAFNFGAGTPAERSAYFDDTGLTYNEPNTAPSSFRGGNVLAPSPGIMSGLSGLGVQTSYGPGGVGRVGGPSSFINQAGGTRGGTAYRGGNIRLGSPSPSSLMSQHKAQVAASNKAVNFDGRGQWYRGYNPKPTVAPPMTLTKPNMPTAGIKNVTPKKNPVVASVKPKKKQPNFKDYGFNYGSGKSYLRSFT